MDIKPLISIVIPTYNRASDLKRALNSVVAQTYSHWECLIVDNHSADNTEAVIQDFNDPRMRLYKIHNNGVIAASRNLGINHAKGKYIAFLDSDDWWKREKLQKSVTCLENGADVVYHDLHGVKKTNQRLFFKRVKCRALKEPVYCDLMCHGNGLANSSVVLKAELLHQIKGFSEDMELIAIEDFEGWCRIAQLTDRFHYISKPLGYYWCGGGNESNAKRAKVNLIRFQTLHLLPFLKKNHKDGIQARGQTNPSDKHPNKIILKTSDSEMPIWWKYSYARALYLTGDYSFAFNLLNHLQSQKLPFALKVKVIYMLFTIKKTSP